MSKLYVAILPALFLFCGISTTVLASSDKTGTNPVNFTHDFRVYNEYLRLNTKGEGHQNVTTTEFRMPFADGKWQFRTRLRHVQVEADLNGDNADDVDDSGLGVVDFRFLTVPYLDMANKTAIAAGVEVSLPTGNAIIGSDTLSLGPQVFGVFFVPFGIKNSLIAPAYQFKFSVDKQHGANDVRQSLFDLFFLKTSADKNSWFMINPQYVVDHETDGEFGFLDVEAGHMLDKYLGTKGHSTYIRPSIGWGQDRVTDGSIEVGYKIVW